MLMLWIYKLLLEHLALQFLRVSTLVSFFANSNILRFLNCHCCELTFVIVIFDLTRSKIQIFLVVKKTKFNAVVAIPASGVVIRDPRKWKINPNFSIDRISQVEKDNFLVEKLSSSMASYFSTCTMIDGNTLQFVRVVKIKYVYYSATVGVFSWTSELTNAMYMYSIHLNVIA